MNGYLRKAQHDENNLNIEVTVEVISDFKVKKASVFNGFKRQTTKNTASRQPAARLSSPSAEFFDCTFKDAAPTGAASFLRSFGATGLRLRLGLRLSFPRGHDIMPATAPRGGVRDALASTVKTSPSSPSVSR